MATAQTAETDAAAPAQGRSKLVLVLVITNVVIVLAAAGAITAFVLTGGNGGAAAAPAEPAETHTMGPLLEVSDVVVNLADPGGTHFLRAGFQFELTDAERQPDVESHMVPVRSAFMIYFSGLTVEETMGRENREALLEHLKELANEQIGADLVRNIYFTAFVVQ